MRWIGNRAWREILGGVLVIAVGLVRRDSVFLGDLGILPVCFDAVGVFFVVLGLVRMMRAKSDSVVPPSATPPNG